MKTGTQKARKLLTQYLDEAQEIMVDLDLLLAAHQNPPRPDDSFTPETFNACSDAKSLMRETLTASIKALRSMKDE